MPMVKKSISVTDQQDAWIKAQIETATMATKVKSCVNLSANVKFVTKKHLKKLPLSARL